MKSWMNKFKLSVIILFVAIAFSSCLDDSLEGETISYTSEQELAQMKTWLDSMVARKKDIDTTSTGLFYIRQKTGTGPNVKAEDVVTVKYTGMFVNGTIFDASAYHSEAGTMTYLHKAPTDPNKTLIQGWEEGIEVLNKGASAAFLIPSNKGYGTKGSAKIPPYTPLIFVIEVVDIKSKI
jgi:FKBP-type peptidyl-prolyl cis-trans isomerase FkpA